MSFKRALVVDDSRSARVSLKKLLDEHELVVEFAESGEAALDFLDHELVDVIFMDHTMPGMDGLEAVAAIKRNPRTATIPVMMYTTKEGEVYVSQARALGAVGVLPKQVQPGVLFNMLLDLGLVQERRVEPSAEPESILDEVDLELDKQALGMSLQTVVTRILEDQHLALRADILRGHKDFAKQVAEEVLVHQARELEPEHPVNEAQQRSYSQRSVTMLALMLLVPALVFAGLFVKVSEERDSAGARLLQLDQKLEERLSVAESVTTDLIVDMNTERRVNQHLYLGALQWALNHGEGGEFDKPAYDDLRLQHVETLLEHLAATAFKGTVRLTSHLGEFCLVTDRLGALTPAAPDLPLSECTTIGHPLDDSTDISVRQSPQFVDYLASFDNRNGIRLQLVANDRYSSVRRMGFPNLLTTAGAWNEIAAFNQRVEYDLIPAESG